MTQTKTIPEGYKKTEVGIIPEDWEVKRINNIAKVTRGASPRPINSPIWFDERSKIGWVRISDVTNSIKVLKHTTQKLSEIGIKHSRFVEKNNLIMSICATVGRPILTEIDVCIHDGFVVFSDLKIEKEYLYYILSSVENKWAKSGQTGSQMNLNTQLINFTQIVFPKSKSEQKAIARILSDTDALIESLEKLIAKKKAIKQGAMQQLLTGKKRLPGFSGEWEVKELNEIGNTYGGLSGKTINDFQEGKYPYIPFLNIMNNPVININSFDYVNIRANEKQNIAIKGDLFFNGSSETPEEVGMCSVLLNDIQNLYLNSFCFGFRLNRNSRTDGLYLSYFFRSSVGRKIIFSLAQGATRYNLSKTSFMKLKIPYPNPDEQAAIASILSDMDAEIEKLGQKRDKYILLKQGMMQQLLTGKIRLIKNGDN